MEEQRNGFSCDREKSAIESLMNRALEQCEKVAMDLQTSKTQHDRLREQLKELAAAEQAQASALNDKSEAEETLKKELNEMKQTRQELERLNREKENRAAYIERRTQLADRQKQLLHTFTTAHLSGHPGFTELYERTLKFRIQPISDTSNQYNLILRQVIDDTQDVNIRLRRTKPDTYEYMDADTVLPAEVEQKLRSASVTESNSLLQFIIAAREALANCKQHGTS